MNRVLDLLPKLEVPAFDFVCPACAAAVSRPGLCIDCDDRQRAHGEAQRTTRQSIPPRFAWAQGLDVPELEDRVDGGALARVRALVPAKVDRVTLLGPAGSGKTSLAVALAHAFAANTGKPALFVPAVALGVARQQHSLGAGEAPLVRQAIGAPLLVLDDVGQELEAGSSVVAYVVQHRYDDARPTVVTSGLRPEQLAQRYGAGVFRRLVEAIGGAVVVKLRSRSDREPAR